MEATGIDEARLRDTARDTLRIQAYLNQRFGTTVQVRDEEGALYYRNHAPSQPSPLKPLGIGRVSLGAVERGFRAS